MISIKQAYTLKRDSLTVLPETFKKRQDGGEWSPARSFEKREISDREIAAIYRAKHTRQPFTYARQLEDKASFQFVRDMLADGLTRPEIIARAKRSRHKGLGIRNINIIASTLLGK